MVVLTVASPFKLFRFRFCGFTDFFVSKTYSKKHGTGAKSEQDHVDCIGFFLMLKEKKMRSL